MVVEMASPPLRFPSHLLVTLNISSLSPARMAKKPISRNSGMTEKWKL